MFTSYCYIQRKKKRKMANLFIVYTADARARANSESEKPSTKQYDNDKNIAITNLFSKPNQLLSKLFSKSETCNNTIHDK